MNGFRIIKLFSKLLFAAIVIVCGFLVLIYFNVISFDSKILPETISLNQNELGLKKNGDFQLEALILPLDAYYDKIIWSSSDPKIVSVNPATGYIVAKKTGEAIITARIPLNNITTECLVHVEGNDVLVKDIDIINDSVSLSQGSSYTIRYRVTPSDANMHDYSFTSSDNAVAIVNENGIIKAISEGTAIITMKSKISNVKDTIKVNVYKNNKLNNTKPPVNSDPNNTYVDTSTYNVTQSVTLNKTNISIAIGAQTKLIGTVLPSNANQKINYSSSNDNVVRVDDNGTITGVKAGTASVIATSIDGKTAICKVEVTSNNTTSLTQGIDIKEQSYKMEIGTTKKFDVNFYLVDSSKQGVIWSSSNEYIANVVDGVVYAKKVGSCIIKVSSADMKYSDYVTVTVVNASNLVQLSGISFENTSYNLGVNNTITLKPIINPSTASNYFLEWTTSNRNVATVSNGVVTGVANGTATITAKSSNGVSSSVTVVISTILPSSISIENYYNNLMEIKSNETKYLIKKILPSNATDQNVTWTSSNTSIVTVDSNGQIKGISRGSATITAKTSNGKSCIVNVKVI